MKTEHTPAPWIADNQWVFAGNEPAPEICHCPKDSHAQIGDNRHGIPRSEAIANAEFIVRACNVHEELLKALKQALQHLEWCGYGDNYERECAIGSKLPDLLESAIAKAEGK